MKKLSEKYSEELKENSAKGYDAYLAKNGIRARESYLDSVMLADVKKDFASTNYGSLAAYLKDDGLSGSGYEQYLKSVAAKDYESRIKLATRDYSENEYKNQSGYQKYLSDYDKLQAKISQNLIKTFGEGTSFSIEDAYEKAIAAGLNEENAIFAAAKAVSTAKINATEAAITFAKLNGLTPYRAKEYAESLGLDEKYAEKVYDALKTLTDEEKNFFSSMSPQEYYEYIKERAN